jgi:hypothetical protein
MTLEEIILRRVYDVNDDFIIDLSYFVELCRSVNERKDNSNKIIIVSSLDNPII